MKKKLLIMLLLAALTPLGEWSDEQPDPDPIEGPACAVVCWLRHPTGECDHD